VELRAYSLAVMLVAASTLLLLLAIDRRGWGWWIAYAAFSCAAMYTHYTAVYVLAAQAVWALVVHRDLVVRILAANAAAALLYVPWLPGLREDLEAPSREAIANIAPFNIHNVFDFTTRFLFGSPSLGIGEFYGPVVEIGLAGGLLIALIGIGTRLAGGRAGRPGLEGRHPNLAMLLATALAAPVGVALVSLFGDDQYLPRNLATSAPAALILLAWFLLAGPRWSRICSVALVVAVFAYGAVRTTEARFQRFAYGDAAELIDETAAPKDVVLDVGLVSPNSPPAYALDISFTADHPIFDSSSPGGSESAVRAAKGHRLYLVGFSPLVAATEDALGLTETETAVHVLPGIIPLTVATFQIPP